MIEEGHFDSFLHVVISCNFSADKLHPSVEYFFGFPHLENVSGHRLHFSEVPFIERFFIEAEQEADKL